MRKTTIFTAIGAFARTINRMDARLWDDKDDACPAVTALVHALEVRDIVKPHRRGNLTTARTAYRTMVLVLYSGRDV